MIGATPAHAAGVVTVVPQTGDLPMHNGVPVLEPNTDYTLTLQHGPMDDGQIVDIDFSGIQIPDSALNVPASNTAIDRIERTETGIRIFFEDPYPTDVNQGIFDLIFRVDAGEQTEQRPIGWSVEGTPGTVEVVVKDPEDVLENVQKTENKASAVNLQGLISLNGAQVVVSNDITNREFTYTITYSNAGTAATESQISDELGPFLAYVDGSFSATLTTWDENGFNQQVTPVEPEVVLDGTSFVDAVTLPAKSIYTLTYKAKPTDVAGIQAALQESFDNVGADGRYEVSFGNTAIIGDVEKTTEDDLFAHVARPDTGATFAKTGSVARAIIETDDDGNLIPVLPIDYTLTVDLLEFDPNSDSPFFVLRDNVMVYDTLPAGMEWLLGDANFITTTDGVTLTPATGVENLEQLKGDAYVNQYWIDGQTIHFNVGKESRKFDIVLKAQVNSVDKANVWPDAEGNLNWWPKNTARLSWVNQRGDSGTHATREFTTHLREYVPTPGEGEPSGPGEITDGQVFNKTTDNLITVIAGERVPVPYTFTVNNGAIEPVDLNDITITDQLDVYTFDPALFSSVIPAVTVNWQAVSEDQYDFNISPDGVLTFNFNDNFTGDPLQVAEVKFTLETFPVEGKQSLTIRNEATLTVTGYEDVFTNWSSSEGTSYGDELEVKKTVYDPSRDRFSGNLRVDLDALEDGDNEFIYRVEVIGRGSFGGIAILPIVDLLPEGVDFVGFVAPENVAGSGEIITLPEGQPYQLGASLQAVWQDAERTVLITNQPGTTFPRGQRTELFFKVALEDITEDVPVANVIGGTSAVITPSDDYPLKVAKVDSRYSTRTINPASATAGVPADELRTELFRLGGTFSVTGTDFDVEAFVYNGQLSVFEDGVVKALRVKNEGTYTVTEQIAPAGYSQPDPLRSFTVVVDEELGGQVRDVTIANDPLPRVSVGDYVWLDANRDGIQNDGAEAGIEDVVLVLTGPDGQPVLDVFGNEVLPTTTDAAGLYSFDNLPVLTGDQTYTVTIDQAASAAALGNLVPTLAGVGGEDTDSSTWTTSSVLPLTADAQRDPTLDFGFYGPSVSLGDYVWWDTNRDGIQNDGDDAGIEGIELQLTGPDGGPVTDVWGNEVAPTFTDDSGYYVFSDLPTLSAGESYTVTIIPTEGMVPTVAGAGDDPAVDSSTGTATSTGLTNDKDHDPTLDFGFIPTVSVGDYVWWDEDRDGIQDAGEPGIPGVTLTISRTDGEPVENLDGTPRAELTTTTDENGKYTFDGLPVLPEDVQYVVTVTPPTGAEPTLPEVGDNNEVDSSTGSATARNDLRTAGAHDPTLDFGFVKAVSVGDYVWWDNNRDGIQDEGEPGIEGVRLTISRTDDEPVENLDGTPRAELTTTTDEQGRYIFSGLPVLPEGVQYVVTVTPPAGATPTLAEAGDDNTVDSSTGSATARDDLREAGEHDPTLDFGFIPKVSVGDYVWWDNNRDGKQDEGEPGIPGVTLTLVGPDGEPVTDIHGNVVEPTETDDDGFYEFTDLPVLPAGDSYRVIITPPDGAVPTVPGDGTDPANDSSTGYADSGDLTQNDQRDDTLDFGFIPRVSVGDYVWWDNNMDGIQDKDEPGIPSMVLTIVGPDGEPVTDVHGNEVGAQITDATGFYEFVDLPVLPAGQSYTVKIAYPSTMVPTVANAEGVDRANDSSTDFAVSSDLTVDGASDPTLDFGFIPKVSVGDKVWWDTNRDGKQDEGEPGIPDVTLNVVGPDGEPVTDIHGNPVEPTTTDESGFYEFTNLPVLPAGDSYRVVITPPEGAVPTVPNAEGVDPSEDSSTGHADSGDLTNDGDRDSTLDFGFVPEISVGDYVWWDNNLDGIQDEGEPGIPGVTLTITRTDGEPVTNVLGEVLTTTTTNDEGNYSFDRLPVLPEGEFYVVTVTPPEGATPTVEGDGTSPLDSSTGSATARDLRDNGDRDPTLDFGFIPKVSVGDKVWWDTNRDGKQDPGEPGIPGVELKVVGPDGEPVTDIHGNPVEPTTTDDEGNYTFEDLPVLPEGESYRVIVTPPAGAVPTVPGDGTDRENDSSTDYADSSDLTKNGDRDDTLDFGFVPEVSVGDYVWWDNNLDGIQDEGEPGIPGVTLTITRTDGEPVTNVLGDVLTTTTTDDEGYYSFDRLPVLPEGEFYVVTITAPEGAEPTKVGGTEDTGLDSSTGSATARDLRDNGDRDPTLDFGFIPKVSVGDYVWWDNNRDGIQDAGEPGVPGITLTLVGPDGEPVTDVYGNPVEPTVTDANGLYLFENLPVLAEGESYRVVITAPEGAVATKAGAGDDRAADSSTGHADSVGLTANGQHDPTLDFGFIPKVSVGDYVWFDENKNGRQDANEDGINGVVLVILGPDGQPVVDVHGNVVGPQTTRTEDGKSGYYLFADLPVLADGQFYTVRIDREASADALTGFEPTTANVGDRAGDSDTWAATSVGLTLDGEHDPTLDFGFVRTPRPTAPSKTGVGSIS